MEKGVHTIRSGWTENSGFTRKYSLDNGDYKKNMMITDVQLIYTENDDSGGNQDKINGDTIFFCIATSEAGATPTATTSSPEEYGTQFALRLSDSRQIAWGVMGGNPSFQQIILDPDNIIPGDLYVSAWSITSGGTITDVANSFGFMIKMKQVTSSGDKALLYRVRETDLE